MSIITTKEEKSGTTVYKYNRLSEDILYSLLGAVLERFREYLQVTEELKTEDVDVNTSLLCEALVRIDKRKDYFLIFHDSTDISEIKETALLAYWLIKLKPFRVNKDNTAMYKKYVHINEAFAIFLIYSVVKQESICHKDVEFCITDEYNKKIRYAFCYWDISKEALMLVVESLCEGMYFKN